MAWNIGLLCIKTELSKVDDILDVFYKSEDGLHFEDVTSFSMEDALGVGEQQPWIIIVDTQGRFINDVSFPLQLSKQYKVKTFWISEKLIYRDYYFNFLKKGGLKSEVVGIDGGLKYLNSKGIQAIDKWGETIIFQIIENEIFNRKTTKYGTSLNEIRYLKYEL
ncbi:hypothetical protein [Paenibacillus sp. MABNR03]|uniref:hypothetical protein n=1 Tax=Paenibacillus sp. MABNR03 TaxID=3142626 RepID=UPI003D27E207